MKNKMISIDKGKFNGFPNNVYFIGFKSFDICGKSDLKIINAGFEPFLYEITVEQDNYAGVIELAKNLREQSSKKVFNILLVQPDEVQPDANNHGIKQLKPPVGGLEKIDGVSLIVADNPRQGFLKSEKRQQTPDLVIADLWMHGATYDGFCLLERIRNGTPLDAYIEDESMLHMISHKEAEFIRAIWRGDTEKMSELCNDGVTVQALNKYGLPKIYLTIKFWPEPRDIQAFEKGLRYFVKLGGNVKQHAAEGIFSNKKWTILHEILARTKDNKDLTIDLLRIFMDLGA